MSGRHRMRSGLAGSCAALAVALTACVPAGCGAGTPRPHPGPTTPPAATPGTSTITTTTTTVTRPTAATPVAQPAGDWLPPGIELPHPSHPTAASIIAHGVFGGWRYPVNAVRAFALVYGNWTAASVVEHLRTLALFSVDQARSLVELQAAETASDYELGRGGIANAASVESIAPAPGAPDTWIVVTRERTTATRTDAYAGLSPAWHVTLASVAQVHGVWVVSRWQSMS